MHVDHLTFVAGPEGLKVEAARLGAKLGVSLKDGGFHPRFGTRNHILPLAGPRYIEVVEVLDHPAADKAVYGQAVRARSEMGGGWMGWSVAVDDLAPYEERLHRESVPGSRQFPDGRRLQWHQIGIKGLIADPQLPYFIHWESPTDLRPTSLEGVVRLDSVELSGSRERVEDWLGESIPDQVEGINFDFTSPNGHPGINAVVLDTPDKGLIRI
ncbi:VOC family protein [Acidipropionibacterium jensenii]|uniref:VOC family protein n=1 Tax=Acidipropionibacterium jensenii TaxID=1749 RepID=A0A3Q9UN65_9ACTN|nr:VOC family protein [Acidipropionibacterium jensenii]AZZ38743.1 VOC family protein [Acidipropionibacterium jensenii]AZZ41267.1 VOC family protein [Acidipropionibacterium jensenii]MDN5976394.1 VOC family protein [Acidipropionibacterium jensenii]MDN5996945.1 VOC family protein [Acidipropionibacterium jensenii]MDN6021911.1 VOC family protein [Acidipropionibacterium jensenii]